MSYDKPIRETYHFLDATFGATTVTHNIIGPKGMVGFVRDIIVDVKTDLVGTTTVPEIDVGTASGDTTYGRFRLGTAAGTAYLAAGGVRRASQTSGLTGNPPRNLQDFAHHVELDGYPLSGAQPQGRIPVDTAIVITCKAGTGGTPAGGGDVFVVIEWQGGTFA
jgi:hypothetical protein